MRACIGEPISWLRLERFALGARRPGDRARTSPRAPRAGGASTRSARDAVALPRSPCRAARARAGGGVAARPRCAAAAALASCCRRPRDPRAAHVASRQGRRRGHARLVRERPGAIASTRTTFAAGDRWKVVVTLPAGRRRVRSTSRSPTASPSSSARRRRSSRAATGSSCPARSRSPATARTGLRARRRRRAPAHRRVGADTACVDRAATSTGADAAATRGVASGPTATHVNGPCATRRRGGRRRRARRARGRCRGRAGRGSVTSSSPTLKPDQRRVTIEDIDLARADRRSASRQRRVPADGADHPRAQLVARRRREVPRRPARVVRRSPRSAARCGAPGTP